jgi:DNA-binding MarR family transcriptional regulator
MKARSRASGRARARAVPRAREAARRSPSAPATGAGEVSLGRVLEFMRLLWAVEHGLTRLSRRLERTRGLTGPQQLVIRLVGSHPGISAGALARTLHLHPSTLTEVLRRLTERGLLERTHDPADARRALFRVARKGLPLRGVRPHTGEARIRAALAAVSDRDFAAATRVLARVVLALSDDRA